MTVASIYAPVTYLGDGITVDFPFPFPFFKAADLRVSLIDAATDAIVSPPPILDGEDPNDYRVIAGSVDEATAEILTATVTFNTAPAASLKVFIEREVAQLQVASLSDDAPFPAKSVEASLDRAMMAVQDVGKGAEVATDIALAAAEAARDAANDAAGFATAADADAEAALALLRTFEEKYLGAKTSDPSTDNQGHPLQTGAIYYNSISHLMFVWDGTEWIGITAAAVLVPGSVTTPILADGAVTTVKLGNSSVTTVNIGDNQIVTSKIGDLSVTSNKLGDGSVVSLKLADGSVITRTLGTGAVTTVTIFDGAVIADKIATDAVVADKIAAGQVVAGKMAVGAVNAGSIIVGDIIVTGHLRAAAATIFTYASGASLQNIVNDAIFHDLCGFGFTSEGAPCIVAGSVLVRNDDNTTHGILLRVVRNGTNGQVRVFPNTGNDGDGAVQLRQSDGQTWAFSVADTPGAGAASYSLQYQSAGSPNVKCLSPYIQAAEIKR